MRVCVLIIINQQPQHAGETTGMLTEQIEPIGSMYGTFMIIYVYLPLFTCIWLIFVVYSR